MMIAALFFTLGLLIRFFGERSEQIQLRGLSHYLASYELDDVTDLEPDEVTTAVDRTKEVLASTKLLRLISLLVMIPSTLLLVTEFINPELEQWGLHVLISSVIIFLIIFTLSFFSRFYSDKMKTENPELPEWTLDKDLSVPFFISLFSQLWEALFRAMSPALSLLGLDRQTAHLFESEGMFRLDLNGGEEEGQENQNQDMKSPISRWDRTEDDMIQAIHRLDQTFVREIMKPINQVTAIRLRDYTPQRFLELSRSTGFTRIPYYEERVTDLMGYINVYDLLDCEELPKSLDQFLNRPLFFPEVARVDKVLQEMITSKKQVAIIYDEFGATCGWLSREDIFEEIVGEVEDEYEKPQSMIEPFKDGYIANPMIDLDDLNDEIGLELTKDQCDTLGGFIYYRIGRTPKRGETIQENGWAIRVAGLDNYRIRRVRLTKLDTESDS